MAILRPRIWTQQPQMAVGMAPQWGGRVLSAAVGDELYNVAASMAEETEGTIVLARNADNVGRSIARASGNGVIRYSGFAPGSDWTIVTTVTPTSVTGTLQLFSLDANGVPERCFQFRTNGTGIDYIRFNTATSAFTASIASILAVGKPITIVAVTGGASVELYAGGKSATATITGTPTAWTSNLNAGWCARENVGTYNEPSTHKFALRAVIRGRVSSAEAIGLANNPWQIFAPRVT